jgi:hypothetical protein
MRSAGVVDQLVSSDRDDPGDRVRTPVEGVPVSDRIDYRLLRQLLGDGAHPTAGLEEVPVHARERGLVPGAEGGLVFEQHSEATRALPLRH